MLENWKAGAPLPASVGLMADEYHDVRALRLAMEKEVEAVKARETELKEAMLDTLSASDDTGASGARYRAQVVKKRKAQVADWGALTAWIRKNDRFDMLQRRLSDKAALDFEEAEGRAVPGVEMLYVKDLSITKI
jgi:hypothetical protein